MNDDVCVKIIERALLKVLPPLSPFRMIDGYEADCPLHVRGNRALFVRLYPERTPTIACQFDCDSRAVWKGVGIDPDDVPGSLIQWLKKPAPPRAARAPRHGYELRVEATIIETAMQEMMAGQNLSVADMRRVIEAAARIREAVRP